MKKSTLCIYLTIIITLISLESNSQNITSALDSIKANSKLWDIAFNERDTTTYFKFVMKNIAETVGGGTRLGIKKFKAEIFPFVKSKNPGLVKAVAMTHKLEDDQKEELGGILLEYFDQLVEE